MSSTNGSNHMATNGHATMNALFECNTTEELMRRYDEMALNYDRVSDSTGFTGHIQTAEKVSELEPNRSVRVLDVGCGTGRVGEVLQTAGYKNLYGVDLSEKSLKVADKKKVYSELIQANFGSGTPLNYEDGSFDVAVSTGCFLPQHLNETHLPEMIRLVKKGGYVIITTRKQPFDSEEGDLKVKSCLETLAKKNLLRKVCHDYFMGYMDGVMGVMACYQVL